jgi:KR domain
MRMEIAEIFGGLFEEDQGRFPLSAIKHAQGFDVVKVSEEGVAQMASLQPIQDESSDRKQLRLDSEGAYLITGGTRGMGLEIAAWMGRRGASRIVLVSRRGLPLVVDSEPLDADGDKLVSRITELEALGATIHVPAIDLSKPGADATLGEAIDRLNIPPIRSFTERASQTTTPSNAGRPRTSPAC